MLTSSWASVGVDDVVLAQLCPLGPYSMTVLVCPDEQGPGAEGPAQSLKSGLLVARQARVVLGVAGVCTLLRDSGPLEGHPIAGKIGLDQPRGPLEHRRANGSWSLAKILMMPTTLRGCALSSQAIEARSPGVGGVLWLCRAPALSAQGKGQLLDARRCLLATSPGAIPGARAKSFSDALTLTCTPVPPPPTLLCLP